MASDSGSISNGYTPCLSRDSTKKKRPNGLAKLKRMKLDVRREQWLSRVKKGSTLESNGRVVYSPPSLHIGIQNGSLDNLEMMLAGEDEVDLSIHDGDLMSMMNSPAGSSSGDDDSRNGLGESSRSSSVGSMSSFPSRNLSEEEDDDGCVDDWEAVADALSADENQHKLISESALEHERISGSSDPQSTMNPRVEFLKPESRTAAPVSDVNSRAWKPDDAFRPQSLPNLSKQPSSVNSDWHSNHGSTLLSWKCCNSQPSPCPICCEDFDVTDSCFLPCSCGFRLCLFCHKRILEADARCPGCRKLYNHRDGNVGLIGDTAFRVTHSCSMSTRV
ncbi:General negative regulator of transcription subunit 4 [Quillaja saponaria]|uniref:General negative regulator of transcription subunit 4 n=1 Tax=Quillaja saponaria TaxID=32244 RepID=A0AAD7Q461_QUISA|nr:General negative regulator of transcription subunit 4 [Quillaja saponaria]KAJ7974486.1 General negative regulator of transcription subunit 4 [Quillaja saponaria]